MTSEYFFVRENFIKFTVSCLPHFNNVMNDNDGYKHLFEIGANFIIKLTEYISQRIEIDMKGRKDTEKFSLFDNNGVIFNSRDFQGKQPGVKRNIGYVIFIFQII